MVDTGLNNPSVSHTPYARLSDHWQDRTAPMKAGREAGREYAPIIEQTLANSKREQDGVGEQNGSSVMRGYGRMKSFHVRYGEKNVVTQSRLSSCLVQASHTPHSRFSDHWQDRTTPLEADREVGWEHAPIIGQTLASSNREQDGIGEQNGGGATQGYGRMKSFHVGCGGKNVLTQSTLSSYLVQESSSVTDSGYESEGGAFDTIDTAVMGASGGTDDGEESDICEVIDAGSMSEARHEQSVSDEYLTAVMEWLDDECSLVERPLSAHWLERRCSVTVGSETLGDGRERKQQRDGGRHLQKFWRESKNVVDRQIETSTDVFEQRGPSKVRYNSSGHRRAVLKEGFKRVSRVFRGRAGSRFSKT